MRGKIIFTTSAEVCTICTGRQTSKWEMERVIKDIQSLNDVAGPMWFQMVNKQLLLKCTILVLATFYPSCHKLYNP